MDDKSIFDLFIIGGGINGTAIAADAAGRGLSVMLCEQNDLGSGTSSASSKLIHGGLRYLEQYEFKMVKEALIEREILLKNAPHLVQPLQFVLPHSKKTRPVWLITLGLFLYDHLYKHKLIPQSKKLNLKKSKLGKPLKSSFVKGFTYFDCFSDDARLVIANAKAAKNNNAQIMPHREMISAVRVDDLWQISIRNKLTQVEKTIYSKALVNATGPWIDTVLAKLGISSQYYSTLVKGSHIVINKFYLGDQAYILQNDDKRIVFVIPFLENYLLIGTTDINYQNDPAHAQITSEEITYLCATVNNYFEKQINPKDVIWSYAGVRALVDGDEKNLTTITRSYKLDISDSNGKTPLLSVFGGKLTTHRRLAEEALNLLSSYFPNMSGNFTDKIPLPGGDIPLPWSNFLNVIFHKYSWLPKSVAYRYAKTYGSAIHELLQDCGNLSDLGFDFGGGLYQKEVEYLIINEWAVTADDILWRRTKLGLTATHETIEQLTSFLTSLFARN